MFAMTFFIVLFIVLMQFLWRYMDDLVGKGLSIGVLAELFFYAAVSMVPMALPLAILLASLMTFGNLGEKSELTAIKASGVSLLKVMSPLIVLIGFIAVGAFFFQNNVLPKAQVKMWTLLFSARQKSPELEIPEGSFYDQIPGYNIYVKSKNRDTGMLYNVMIYDVRGDNGIILLADSARLAFSPDMQYLYLRLWTGEQFENLRSEQIGNANIPFRRESFLDKELLIPFDANFNKLSEEGMRNQYVGKNIAELRAGIDSLTNRIDSLGLKTATDFNSTSFPILLASGPRESGNYTRVSEGIKETKTEEKPVAPLSLDSLLMALAPAQRAQVFNAANSALNMRHSELEFRSVQIGDEKTRIRRHRIELIKKYTLSVACIIFLFIGAPLGAIIRKGGLGAPLVISVLLFLVYYIIDNTGFKMAREGIWEAWAGMWLSTFILLPLGIFVTYKAMNDSAVFNADIYKEWIRRVSGLPESRHLVKKEVIINDADHAGAEAKAARLERIAAAWLRRYKARRSYADFWLRPYRRQPVERMARLADGIVADLADSRDVKVIAFLNRFPVMSWLWIFSPVQDIRKYKQGGISRRNPLTVTRKALMWIFPVGLPLYLISLPYSHRLHAEVKKLEELAKQTKEQYKLTKEEWELTKEQ